MELFYLLTIIAAWVMTEVPHALLNVNSGEEVREVEIGWNGLHTVTLQSSTPFEAIIQLPSVVPSGLAEPTARQ